jgi:hypothetical protein
MTAEEALIQKGYAYHLWDHGILQRWLWLEAGAFQAAAG